MNESSKESVLEMSTQSDQNFGYTVFHYLAKRNHYKTLKLLLDLMEPDSQIKGNLDFLTL